MLEKAISFAGKRVATLSEIIAKGDSSLHTRGRHAEANVFFQELQRLRKIETKKKREKAAA